MIFLAGTSGYSYKEWKGSFYPDKLPAKQMLEYYAEQLPAVEINNTFYRLPREEVLESWADSVPEHFVFVVKASRRITHLKRLRDVGDETEYLLDVLQALGPHLGAILFQLPPNMKMDLDRLRTFLDLLPGGCRAAFEFRHESWFDDAVFDTLRQRGFPVCYADIEEDAAPESIPDTASWGYVRLRQPGYTDDDLTAWADQMAAHGWERAFVFFKHEDEAAGPAMAKRFLQLVDESTKQ